jgi:hypothetical protein
MVGAVEQPRARAEFAVVQFFADESYEVVCEWVDAATAVAAAISHSRYPAALAGIVHRVIITDGEDLIAYEWKHGEGIVFPPEGAGCDPASANLERLGTGLVQS